MTKTEYHICIETNELTAVEWLANAMLKEKLSKNALKEIMQKGCVWIETRDAQNLRYTQRLRRAKKRLKQGDILHCYYDKKVLNTPPPTATLVSDEGGYSIWNKPAEMLSQGSKWGDHCTIYRWAEKHLQPERPAFIVHRLDRAASGLMIIAHKKQVAAQFSSMFQQRLIKKCYHVSVLGDFSKRLKKANKSTVTINNQLDGKDAISHFNLISYNSGANYSLLEVTIETGRKHQIRKHLSQLGYPVIGDQLYGKPNNTATPPHTGLKLSATSLSFKCPITLQKKDYKIDINQCE